MEKYKIRILMCSGDVIDSSEISEAPETIRTQIKSQLPVGGYIHFGGKEINVSNIESWWLIDEVLKIKDLNIEEFART